MKRWQPFAIGAAVLGLVGYFYFTRGFGGATFKSIGGTPASSIPGVLGTRSPLGWQTVNRPDDGFSVEMPADSKGLQVPAYNEAGSTEPIQMLSSSPDSDTTYAIAWDDNPPVARVNNRALDKTLQMAREGMLARSQTTLVNETHVSAAGFPGLDILAKNSQGGVLDARLIYTGQRLYTLVAVFPSMEARREQDVTRFFNSFAPSATPGATIPEAPPPAIGR